MQSSKPAAQRSVRYSAVVASRRDRHMQWKLSQEQKDRPQYDLRKLATLLAVACVLFSPKLKLCPIPRRSRLLPSSMCPFILRSDGEWRLPYDGIEIPRSRRLLSWKCIHVRRVMWNRVRDVIRLLAGWAWSTDVAM